MLVRMQSNKNSHSLVAGIQNGSHLRRQWQFRTALSILLPRDPAMTLLDIYPKELKTYVHAKTCTQMFIAA